MLLTIPSIHIRDGKCAPPIEYFESHDLPSCTSVSDRVRLLRMENAKSIHLFFDENEAYSEENLALICEIRAAVDLPLGLTISALPTIEQIRTLYDCGIYRLSFRSYDDLPLLKEVTSIFSNQQLAYYIELNSSTQQNLALLKSLGACRVICDLSTLDDRSLSMIDRAVCEHSLRLSGVARVLKYADFARIKECAPSLDSIILDGVLERDSFPCQKIWRINEERAYAEGGMEANLWRNPLEGTPHI